MNRYEFTAEQRALLEGLSQPLAIYQFLDKRVVTLILSDGFCDLFGYEDRAQAYFDMDNNMYVDTHPDDAARIADAAFRFATEGGTYEVIYRTKKRNASGYRIIHAMGKHVHTDDGVRLAHVWYTDEGTFADESTYVDEEDAQRTELNRTLNNSLHEESIVRANNYDYLTGLPSMTYFFELADAFKDNTLESGEMPVLLYMDFSGMKFFNTQNGFAAGDKLLQEFAKLLRATFSNESCCRMGSDHFAAFTREEGLEETLDRFLEQCEKLNDGNSLPLRVGIYPGRIQAVPVSMACDRAKFACDSLSNTFKSGYSYYNSDLRDDAERRRYVITNLDRALNENWIQVHYQPIIRAVTGRVCDEEALSRWIDPNTGLLPPNHFIPELEDAGIIYKLDLYVLERTLEKMQLEADAGLFIVPHSINLSRSDFFSCDIVEEVRKRVDDSGIRRDLITIEITESTLGSDFEFMKEQVKRFQNLGFPVWMDDFGSGYSSLDVLQGMKFDLIKFDMSFMRRLSEKNNSSKVVLTELMKMATSLGVDTVCEGVETEEQVQFLREIGCAKLQGFYFCKPITLEGIIERYEKGIQIGYENPAESAYYDAIGRVNLYDLAVIASDGEEDENDILQKYFNTLPMGIMEIDGDSVEFVRTNQSYRDFIKRFFGMDLDKTTTGYSNAPSGTGKGFMELVRQCCDQGNRAFFDETMPDGSVVHSFARRIGKNPVTEKSAAAIAVLSISEPNEGATYASIARALAADYYNIYYVDLDTGRFIEYSSPIGGDALAMERHGEHFFEASQRDTMTRIYKADRESFLTSFTKENVVNELDRHGVYTTTYRLIESGKQVYASMKVTRLSAGSNQIIVGVSIIDSRMKDNEFMATIQRERDIINRITALSENYLSMFTIDPETGRYFEYDVTEEFASLGYGKEGGDFFKQAAIDAQTAFHPDDVPGFVEWIAKENIRKESEEHGSCTYSYRLMMHGEPQPVSLRIALVHESDGDRLVAGVRAWKIRKSDQGA